MLDPLIRECTTVVLGQQRTRADRGGSGLGVQHDASGHGGCTHVRSGRAGVAGLLGTEYVRGVQRARQRARGVCRAGRSRVSTHLCNRCARGARLLGVGLVQAGVWLDEYQGWLEWQDDTSSRGRHYAQLYVE